MAKAASGISKNAKTNRGGTKIFCNGIEVCPVLIILEKTKYFSAQNKATKEFILDNNGMPAHWNLLKKEEKNS